MGRRLVSVVGLCALVLAGCAKAEVGGTPASSASSVSSAAASATPSQAGSSTETSATPASSVATPGAPASSASTEPSEPASSATPTRAPGQGRTVTTVMSGDLLWHNTVWRSAERGNGRYDFDPMFAQMKPIISGADVAICHAEVPFALPGNAPAGYPMFGAPPQIAPWLRTMGWDACGTASNHSIDQGFKGLVNTHQLMLANGITPVGTWPTEAERHKPTIVTTKSGVKVGLVGGTYSLNGLQLPSGKEWAVSLWDAPNLLAQAKATRAAGADIVIVNVHGGNEYQHQPTAEQKALFAKLAASPDIDLVVGEHAHVVQPITKIKGKWVVYGMGNMVAQHMSDQPRGYEGISVRFTFTEKPEGGFEVSKAEYIPTYITRYGGRDTVKVIPVKQALANGQGDTARMKVALAKTRAAVNLLGPASGLVEA